MEHSYKNQEKLFIKLVNFRNQVNLAVIAIDLYKNFIYFSLILYCYYLKLIIFFQTNSIGLFKLYNDFEIQ